MIKKNKPITIFLLVAVIAIYGSIAYRSFYGNQKIEEVLNQMLHSDELLSVNYYKDSFKIDFYLKDPFGGRSFSTKGNNNPTIVKPIIINKDIKKDPMIPLKWPSLKYYGFVKNTVKKNGLYLVSFNNQLTKMKLGET